MAEQVDYYLFPLVNDGFRVVDNNTYAQMIHSIVIAQIELAEEYPDQKIIVYYEVGDGDE